MKRIFIVALMALLAVMLATTVTQATTLTLLSTHNLTPTVLDNGTATYLNPTSGTIKAGVGALAEFPLESPIKKSQTTTISNPASNYSASGTLTSGTSLTTTTASVDYTGSNQTLIMSQTYVVKAPSPSGGDGDFTQYGYNTGNAYSPTYFTLTYTMQSGHNYHVGLQDIYTYLYQLVNSSGANVNLFDSTTGQLRLYAGISYSSGNFSGDKWIVGDQLTGPDSRSGTPVANFLLKNSNQSGDTATLGFDITNSPGGTLTFTGWVVAEDEGTSYTGSSAVPAPPTLLLLGSGLVGLLALRRRRKVSKS